MKKIYIIPRTTVVKVETAHMIAASNPEGFRGVLNSTGGDGSSALSRSSDSFWDDEDDNY